MFIFSPLKDKIEYAHILETVVTKSHHSKDKLRDIYALWWLCIKIKYLQIIRISN